MPELPDFARVFDALPNAYMIVDRDLCYVAANQTYLRITGSRLQDLLGRNVFEQFPNDPDDPANEPARMLRDSLERVLTTRRRDVLALIPYRVYASPGSKQLTEERFWSASHTPLLDENGEVELIVQHTVDVTELERARLEDRPVEAGVLSRAQQVQAANRALEAQRIELLQLFDQAPGFVAYLVGPDHRFQLANPGYIRLVGGRDVSGLPVAEALPEVVEQGFVALLDRVYATGEPFVGQGVRVELANEADGDASELFLDFIYQPVRTSDGDVGGVLVQGHDVTDRVLADRAKDEARQAAEGFAFEMEQQSREVQRALEQAMTRIRELEDQLSKGG